MNMKKHTRLLALLLCLLCVAALFAACRKPSAEPTGTLAPPVTNDGNTPALRGEGKTAFFLTVTDLDGTQTKFEVRTDEETLADALTKVGLVSGEDSQYGLYIKVVNGITADYDVDQTYWSLLVNGEVSSVGASSVTVTAGMQVELKKEK